MRVRQTATRLPVLRMRAACLSDENRNVWKRREAVTATAQSLQWASSPYSGARGERPPHVCAFLAGVELNAIKSPIKPWEYNFLFWWIDQTPKLNVLFSDSQSGIILGAGPPGSL